MTQIARDLRHGLKMLTKSPLLSAMAILSLALGIGANTTIFSVVNAILLRPLPVHEPERLVTVFSKWQNDERYTSISYPDYRDFRDRNSVFSGLAVGTYVPLGIKGSGRPEMVLGKVVSGNYFDVVGVQLALGRGFLPEEDRTEGTHPVAILSHDAWQTRFGGDPGIIGREVLVNSRPFTVVGVTPRGYRALQVVMAPDIWLPMMMQSALAPQRSLERRGNHYLQMVGRLNPGVTIEQASSHMKTLAAQLAEEHPGNEGKGVALVETNRDRAFLGMLDDGVLKLFMTVLMVVVGLVLLIACSNVANLLLARAAGRQKEMAVRVSLGAGRWQILRQLLTESAVLATLSGLAGLGVAVYATQLIQAFKPPAGFPLVVDLTLDWRVLSFTLVVSALTGILFGLAPAVQTMRSNMFHALRDQRAALSTGVSKSRLQNSLVAGQVALSLLLLVVAGLCVRSLQNSELVDFGFDPEDALTVTVDLGMGQYDRPQGRNFFNRLIERVETIPGVETAGLISWLPLGPSGFDSSVRVEGYEPAPTERMSLYNASVGGRYFEAMAIRVLEGRTFDGRDQEQTRKVAVINQAMANRYWKGESTVGKSFHTHGDDWEVIGVVQSGKVRTLGEAPEPFYYLPASQSYSTDHALVVRTSTAPTAVAAALLRELQGLDPNLPFTDLRTMEEHLGFALLPSKFLGVLMGTFGALALVLSLVGIYGVMAHSVSQRTQEFGVRTALGAQSGDIVRLVLRRGLWISGIGAALGLAAAYAATSALAGFLHGISAVDPLTFGGVTLVLMVVAMFACYIPARRATKVDPMEALRHE